MRRGFRKRWKEKRKKSFVFALTVTTTNRDVHTDRERREGERGRERRLWPSHYVIKKLRTIHASWNKLCSPCCEQCPVPYPRLARLIIFPFLSLFLFPLLTGINILSRQPFPAFDTPFLDKKKRGRDNCANLFTFYLSIEEREESRKRVNSIKRRRRKCLSKGTFPREFVSVSRYLRWRFVTYGWLRYTAPGSVIRLRSLN